MESQFITVKPNAADCGLTWVGSTPIWARPNRLALRRGFTLIELLVVISITAIVAAIALPSMRGTLNDFRQKSAQSLLMSDLNQARAEAIKRNVRVLVCGRNAAGTGCANSTNWQAGWVACMDADSDNVCDTSTASSPNPFIVRPALDAALTLTGTASVLRFNANSSQGSGGAAATLTLGGTWSGAVARVITVAATGNISN